MENASRTEGNRKGSIGEEGTTAKNKMHSPTPPPANSSLLLKLGDNTRYGCRKLKGVALYQSLLPPEPELGGQASPKNSPDAACAQPPGGSPLWLFLQTA